MRIPSPSTFSRNLRWLRRNACLTQAAVGRYAYASHRTVCDWEHDLYMPQPVQMEGLRDLFGDTALLDINRLAWAEARREAGRR